MGLLLGFFVGKEALKVRCHVCGDPAKDVQTTVVRQARHVHSRYQNLKFHLEKHGPEMIVPFQMFNQVFSCRPDDLSMHCHMGGQLP